MEMGDYVHVECDLNPTLLFSLLFVRDGYVAALLHGAKDVPVVGVQVVVEAQEVKLGVP